MPANKKYLTKSPWTKLSKIMAGVVGGYLVSLSFHVALTKFFSLENVMVTSFVTAYIMWATLLLWAFLIKKAWHTWALYAVLVVVFAGIYMLPIG